MFLVPRGAEYHAVMRACARSRTAPPVLAVAAGNVAAESLDQAAGTECIILGLGGALDPELHVGDLVACESASRNGETVAFDAPLTARIRELTGARSGRAQTVDRVVTTRAEREGLRSRGNADVAEMEGYYLANALSERGCTVAMLRVVSDDAAYDLPDIADAIAPDGSLRTWALLWAFARSPLPAARFVSDVRRSLSALEKTTERLISR